MCEREKERERERECVFEREREMQVQIYHNTYFIYEQYNETAAILIKLFVQTLE